MCFHVSLSFSKIKMVVTDMTVPEYLYARLIKAGMTKEGACAVLGNVQHESAFRTNNVEDRSGIADETYTQQINSGVRDKSKFMYDTFGYGLAQWTYPPRKGWMWNYFKERNTSFDDLTVQVDFLIWEMYTHYRSCWDLCCSQGASLYDCTRKLLWEWENPADKEGQMGVRFSSAKEWYSKLSGIDTSVIEVPSGSNVGTPSGSQAGGASNGVPGKPAVDEDGNKVEQTWPPRTIDRNCDGFREIKLLETLLWCHGYNVIVDGIFEEALDTKLRDYQRKNGLDPDGVCGPLTWRKLMSF